MRFPRQARVFHGQLDAAPVAGVVLLLVIFMQVSALLHMPGVLVYLNEGLLQTNPAATLTLNRDETIHFGTNDFARADSNSLRQALQRSSAGPPFYLLVGPNTSDSVAVIGRNLVESLLQIRLPLASTNLVGTANPTVVVAMNFGRYFYKNRVVSDGELRAELSTNLSAAATRSEELTVRIEADEQVTISELTALEKLIGEVGIKSVLIEGRADLPPPGSQAKP